MITGIRIKDLTKRYPGADSPALNQLNLTISPGEIYGYLGANGAGKSTTIRLLLNFIQPSSGSATINGYDVVNESVKSKQKIGYLSGDVALYPKVTGRQMLNYLLRLQGEADKSYLSTLVKRFDANLDKSIAELSKGNRQKIGIIQACMHRPDTLILDEPTSGLDPLMQEAFYDTLREARDRGAAILMSSHNLVEAQTVCDRVGIIKNGKLVREQSMSSDDALGSTIFRVVLSNADSLAKLRRTPHIKFISQEGAAAALVQAVGPLNAALKSLSQFEILELTTEQANLEDEFLEFYGDDQS